MFCTLCLNDHADNENCEGTIASVEITGAEFHRYWRMEEALESIAGWASDEGPLKGKGPTDVAEFARAALAHISKLKS